MRPTNAHQSSDMGSCGFGQSLNIIAALENANDPPVAAAAGHLSNPVRRPRKVGFDEHQAAKRVRLMSVESGGNNHQIRGKALDRRDDLMLECGAEALAAGSLLERHINDVANSGFTFVAGPRVEGRLMRRGVENAGIAQEDVLRGRCRDGRPNQ